MLTGTAEERPAQSSAERARVGDGVDSAAACLEHKTGAMAAAQVPASGGLAEWAKVNMHPLTLWQSNGSGGIGVVAATSDTWHQTYRQILPASALPPCFRP